LQENLIHEQGVAIMPGYTYGPEGNQFLRLNIGCPRSKVETGVNAIINAIKALE
jgi:Bifunctional PLP-dependent enzyme with beta-cystathionase and maltose regulon repressor activities